MENRWTGGVTIYVILLFLSLGVGLGLGPLLKEHPPALPTTTDVVVQIIAFGDLEIRAVALAPESVVKHGDNVTFQCRDALIETRDETNPRLERELFVLQNKGTKPLPLKITVTSLPMDGKQIGVAIVLPPGQEIAQKVHFAKDWQVSIELAQIK